MRFMTLAIASIFAATILSSAPASALEEKPKFVPGGNLGIRKDTPPKEASNTLECPNGKTYKVKTGTDGGTCVLSTNKPGQKPYAVICNDGEKNRASASCDTGCGPTSGGGDCELVKK